MVRINLIGDYEGDYQISILEWVLGFINLVLFFGLIVYLIVIDSD